MFPRIGPSKIYSDFISTSNDVTHSLIEIIFLVVIITIVIILLITNSMVFLVDTISTTSTY